MNDKIKISIITLGMMISEGGFKLIEKQPMYASIIIAAGVVMVAAGIFWIVKQMNDKINELKNKINGIINTNNGKLINVTDFGDKVYLAYENTNPKKRGVITFKVRRKGRFI